MWKIGMGIWIGLALFTGQVHSLELKNQRAIYFPPPVGAVRIDKKFFPGDQLFMLFDIEDLVIDAKTGKASFATTLELMKFQPGKAEPLMVFKDGPHGTDVIPNLGGKRIPGDLALALPRDQAPGKYFVRMTLTDRLAKKTQALVYDFEVVPLAYGVVNVAAPAIGFPGQPSILSFTLIEMGVDKKNNLPSVDIIMKISEGNKQVAVLTSKLPNDLPEDFDAKKGNYFKKDFPIYLNRPGSFVVEVEAKDLIAGKTAKLSYPLRVLDLSELIKK